MTDGPGVVLAAGGLVWRAGADGPEVLVVHRPRYDDWSFPKGKADRGEAPEDTARREVLEETGLQVELREPLPDVRYVDHRGRPKLVRYWAMTVIGGAFEVNDEVDEVAWLAVADAAARLSYPHDVALLQALPAT